MKVYALVYKAEFDCETFDDIYVYDSFEKAHKNFTEIVDGWFNEELFNVEMPTNNMIWETEEYEGHYSKYSDSEYLHIEERDNVVNYLSVRVEVCEVL